MIGFIVFFDVITVLKKHLGIVMVFDFTIVYFYCYIVK
jgi:hypothetical protein